MPTGYTHSIKDGITFEQFALGCARAFGALITMRDEPSDAKIPEKFEPSDFYLKSRETAEAKLAELRAMTPEQCEAAALASYLDACERNQTRRKENIDLRNKYQAMVTEVVLWEPPTPDHVPMKEFMIEQLHSSISFDCGGDYIVDPPKASGVTWLANYVHSLERDIERYIAHHNEEVERAKTRTEWVNALRSSLLSKGKTEMNKVERDKLREECIRYGNTYGYAVTHTSLEATLALLDHIDALERQVVLRPGYSMVSKEVLAWLLGESKLSTGEWFERPEGKGAFWWRSILRKHTLPDQSIASTPESK